MCKKRCKVTDHKRHGISYWFQCLSGKTSRLSRWSRGEKWGTRWQKTQIFTRDVPNFFSPHVSFRSEGFFISCPSAGTGSSQKVSTFGRPGAGANTKSLSCLVVDFAAFPALLVSRGMFFKVFCFFCCGPDFSWTIWTFGRPGAGPIRNQFSACSFLLSFFLGGEWKLFRSLPFRLWPLQGSKVYFFGVSCDVLQLLGNVKPIFSDFCLCQEINGFFLTFFYSHWIVSFLWEVCGFWTRFRIFLSDLDPGFTQKVWTFGG